MDHRFNGKLSGWLLPVDQSRFHIPFLLSLCLLIFFPFLGARDFWGLENHYAEITRVMLVEGNVALPKLNETAWFENPPFFFWLALLFSWLAGQVSEWSMRLVPALSATALVLAFYLFSKKRFGSRIAFLSTVVMATSLLTIHVERHMLLNMIFFLFVTLSMFLLMEVLVFDSSRWSHVYWSWLFMGLVCLTKGPFSLLFPATAVCFYCSLSGRWRKVLALRPLSGAALFLAITAPWFAFVIWKTSGAWADVFLASSNIWRYKNDLVGNLHLLFYSVVHFPLYFIPWSFLFVPAIITFWPERAKIRDGAIQFLFLWFSAILLFSQFYGGEHSYYLFLALPPAALAVGAYLDRLITSPPTGIARLWTRRFILPCCFLLSLAGVAVPVAAAFGWPDLAWPMAIFGVALVGGALGLLYAMRNQNYRAVVCGLALLMIGINLLAQKLILPSGNWLQGRPFAEEIGAIIKPDSRVGIHKTGSYRLLYNFNYYSRIRRFEILRGPKDVMEFLSGPGPRFIVTTRRAASRIKQIWQGDLNLVAEQPAGGPKRWFPLEERWLLLYSCNGGCEPAPSSAKSQNPPSGPLRASYLSN